MAPLSLLSAFSLAALSLQRVGASPAAAPKVVAFDLEKKSVPASAYNGLRKRAASTYTGTIYNAEGGVLYLINATVGTPAQNFQLQLDTGSSDLWVPWAGSNICQGNANLCSTGSFDDTKSSTFVDTNPGIFEIGYGDGTQITGDYINETFSTAGVTLSDITMGLAKDQTGAPGGDTALFTGLVGVGFDTNEAVYSESNGQTTYANFISQLVLEGKVSTRAYSLWLNDINATSGSILFGGVDTSKYTGDLVTLPLQNDIQSGIINTFTVTFAGINVKGDGGSSVYSANTSVPCLLDSGTTLTFLPPTMAMAILNGLGAVNDTDLGGPVVACEIAETAGVLDFQFGSTSGPVISVPVSEFVLPISDPAPKFSNGKDICSFGLLPDNGNGNVFGDTFLRSAYLVYNIDGKSVSIAQTNFNGGSANVKEISAASSIPGVSSTASGQATNSPLPANPGVIPQVAGTDSVSSPSATGAFNLGSPTATSGSGSSGSSSTSKAAAAGLTVPSTSFVGVICTGLTVLFAMLGGSMLIFV